jgi:hypothetical protein
MHSVLFRDADRCAEAIIDRVGHNVRLAVPISIGKPILLIDALYRLAEADRRVQLTIFTGLTLTRPRFRSSLERRFAKPLMDRLFAQCLEPLYAAALREALTVTLMGAVSSDTLKDGRVISGVGGQHDLVAMAHELAGARAIIAVRSTRRRGRQISSNIAWTYANATVPRSLRDIIVSEYGIADVRGRSDRDTIAALVGIADSRFQGRLAADAQRAGKLERSFSLPSHAAANTPARLPAALAPARRDGLLPAFPLGSDLTEVEETLAHPLLALKRAPYGELLRIFLAGVSGAPTASETAALQRLGLAAPAGLGERGLHALVVGTLRRHSLAVDPNVG